MEMTLKNAVGQFVGMDGISVQGTIKAVYPHKEFKKLNPDGSDGKYSYQDIVVEQDGFSATFSLGSRDKVVEADKGKEIRVVSTMRNGQLTGVRVSEDKWADKDGKETSKVKIKVNKNADLRIGATLPYGEPQEDEPITNPEEDFDYGANLGDTGHPMIPTALTPTAEDSMKPPTTADLKAKMDSLPENSKENVLQMLYVIVEYVRKS